MSAEWVSALASLATILVVLVSAIVALYQMRHAASANQITILNEVRERMEAPDFREAFLFVLREMPRLSQDPQTRRRMLEVPLPVEFTHARTVANFFENLGVYVKHRALRDDVLCDMWGGAIARSWEALGPMIYGRRRVTGDEAIYEHFESLAVAAQAFRKRYGTSAHRRGLRKMPEPERWPEVRQ